MADTSASLAYLHPDSKLNRRYIAPGAEMNTGIYEQRRVTMRDARAEPVPPTLASHGFQLVTHRTAVTDFADPEQLDRLYRPEIERLVAELTGADKVVSFGVTIRDVGAPREGAQPAGTDVHTNFTPRRGHHAARPKLEEAGDPGFAYRRFEAINLWRALSPLPQSMPLAVCDGRSVADWEGVANTMLRVPALPTTPEEIARPLSDAESQLEASLFSFRPEHRWFYYPDMTRDELLLFRIYRSPEEAPWRTPHAAFVDESAVDPVPRVSVEARTIAYYR